MANPLPGVDDETERWRTFVTQTDWRGPVVQESWYGHHNPCRRLAMLVHFSSIISTIVIMFRIVPSWPILHPFLTVSELEKITKSHGDCAAAICQAVEPIQMECTMMEDGRLVIDKSLLAVDRVPLPRECHDALRLSFGDDFEHNLLNRKLGNSKEIDLIHFQDSSQESGNNIPLVRFYTDACVADLALLDLLFLEPNFAGPYAAAPLIEFVDIFGTQPGTKQLIEFHSFACPEYMPQWMQKDIIPKSKELYNVLLTWRRSGAVCLVYWGNMVYHAAMSTSHMSMLLLPGLVLWLLLPNSEGQVKRAPLWSTIATLLLLVTLAAEGKGSVDEMIRTAILVISALSFGNLQAAMEWPFLFFLSYMDIGSIGEQFVDLEQAPTNKFMLVLEIMGDLFIPGNGWMWKLVIIYVVYMSFPRRRPPTP